MSTPSIQSEAGPSDWYARSRTPSVSAPPNWRRPSSLQSHDEEEPSFRLTPLRQIVRGGTAMDVAGFIALGTASGKVLVYNFAQEVLHQLHTDHTRVTAIKISPDQTYIACGHASGNVYLWDLARPSKPARTAAALTEDQLASGRKDGHLVGDSITHLDFCGARHTSIVSGDETGKAFWWSLGKVLGVESTDVVRILGSDRRNSTLYAVVTLGDLVALLTPVKLVVVAIKPEPKTVYRKTRSVAANGCAVWNGSVLAFAWDDAVHLWAEGMTATHKVEGEIRSMAWYDEEHLVLVTDELVLLRVDGRILDTAPLLRDARSIRVYRSKIFCLTLDFVQAGELLRWNDRILSCVERGDYCKAIRLAMLYHDGEAPGNHINVPEQRVMADRIRELVRASLSWAFSPDRLYEQGDLTAVYEELAQVFIESRRFIELDDTYEHFVQAGIGKIYLERLEPWVGQVEISAGVAKDLLTHGRDLEKIICNMPPSVLDVDQALRVAEEHGLCDAVIHVYTTLHDYCAPIRRWEAPPPTLFAYLESILTGHAYPSGDPISEGKDELYRMLLVDGYLSLLLARDPKRMLAVLEVAFEDPYLDEAQYSRQAIINSLLPLRQVHSTMFCARNLAKYPQFIRLSPVVCRQLLVDLADGEELLEERQLAAEYLLSAYKPEESIEAVLRAGRFWRLLLQLYERNRDYPQMVRVLLEDITPDTFDSLEAIADKGADDVLAAVPALLKVDIAKTARLTHRLGYTGEDLPDPERLQFLSAIPLNLSLRHEYARLLRDLRPTQLQPYLEQHEFDWARLARDLEGSSLLYALDKADDPALFAHAAALIRSEPFVAGQVVEMAARKEGWDDIVHPLVQTGQLHLVGPLISKLDLERLVDMPGAEAFVGDLLRVFGAECESSVACRRVVGADLHKSVDNLIRAGLGGWRQIAIV